MTKKHTKLSRPLLILALLALMAFTVAGISAAAPDALDDDAQRAAPLLAGDLQSYIVLMEELPVASYDGRIEGLSATKAAPGESLDVKSAAAKSYAAHIRSNQLKARQDAGISAASVTNVYTTALNGFSALMTEAQVEAMAKQDGVRLVLKDQWRQPMTDSSPDFLGLTGRKEAWDAGYTGEGVVVGVIDTGIWPEHPSFADDGSYAAPPIGPLPCEFGNMAHNPDDVPFTCNNKLIGARQMLSTYRAVIGAESFEYDSARDDGGHGTHTASTAAGNGGVAASIFGIPRGEVSGIAPRAHVVAYKGLGFLGGFTSDLAAAIDQAVADGVHVINYSIGGGAGTPGADEVAFLFADDAGVFVATSAGNSGPNPATLGNPGTMPWMTTVAASTQSRFWEGTVVLGDDFHKYDSDNGDLDMLDRARRRRAKNEVTGASITAGTGENFLPLIDAEFAGDELCLPGSLDPGAVGGKIVLCRRGGSARAEKSLAVWMAGGAGMIMYNNSDDDNLASDSHWVPSVHIDQTPGLAIKAYIAGDPDPVAKIIGGEAGKWKYAPSMTIFSSRGPNPVAPDIIKPDITAPGTQILAGYSPTPSEPYDVPGELFAAIQGTSMSSPEVAGAFALLKQAHPDWSAAAARSAIMTTAHQKVKDNDRKSNADPFDMGAGHLNMGKPSKKGSAFQPGLVYNAGLYEYAAFTCGMEWGTFTPGSCDFLESIGVPSDPSDLNYPSIGIAELAGSQTVVRTVTADFGEYKYHKNKPVVFRAKVKSPPGFKVEVTPKKLKLKHGDTATFEVTVTNKNAPVGEWRFGSLTWKGRSYNVYSPIAVKAAEFSAPVVVAGEGAAGSASFDVIFGYSGSYAAAPHGLVADLQTNDDVGQDPDQTYPSGDDAPPGVLKYDFPITGAAFVRWELVIPGDDDVDLFLEDSGGNIIAASTNGGTDELIEVYLPADDTYTMVVHGWSVPSAPLPFTLHYWEVPLASGGSLSVDSAPTSATIGASGTVAVSWSGLANGEYLGAVSHTGDSGLMGLTLVEVDVP